jgi:hypothetical protein
MQQDPGCKKSDSQQVWPDFKQHKPVEKCRKQEQEAGSRNPVNNRSIQMKKILKKNSEDEADRENKKRLFIQFQDL